MRCDIFWYGEIDVEMCLCLNDLNGNKFVFPTAVLVHDSDGVIRLPHTKDLVTSVAHHELDNLKDLSHRRLASSMSRSCHVSDITFFCASSGPKP